jgi:hypothetical protein
MLITFVVRLKMYMHVPISYILLMRCLSRVHVQSIVVDKLNAFCSEGIWLRIRTAVCIEHHIHSGGSKSILGPHLFSSVPSIGLSPSIGIQVVHEADPVAVHEVRQIKVALSLVEERRGGSGKVAHTHDVVEDEGDFLEMGNAYGGWNTRGDSVEAVAICCEICRSPRLARLSARCDERYVPKVTC